MGDNFSAEPGATRRLKDRSPAQISGESSDLADSLRELSELATGSLSLKAMLTKVAEYAVLAIPGAEGAGLTLISPDDSETLVATNQLVSDVDAIQYGIRQGPCITAARERQTVLSHSLGEDKRWPDFGAQVAGLGVHSALSLPLLTPDQVVGAMNIYARHRNAFDRRSADLAQLFAVPAAIAVQNGQVLAHARELTTQLGAAMATRAVIDRALGFLVGRDGISTEEADRRLRAGSQARRITLREHAESTLRQVDRRDASSGPHPGGELP